MCNKNPFNGMTSLCKEITMMIYFPYFFRFQLSHFILNCFCKFRSLSVSLLLHFPFAAMYI